MAFASYVNAFREDQARVMGQFRNAETGNYFEWFDRDDADRENFACEYAHRIFVGAGETRVARVLKSRVHVVVDEDANGDAVTETWVIRGRKDYP